MKNLNSITIKRVLFALFILVFNLLYAAEQSKKPSKENDDVTLLNDYVKSKGAVIVFDEKNIKQFWIDKSVISKDNSINVLLVPKLRGGFESVPLKIQLANVNETMDCRVEVITNCSDASFEVTNNSLKVLSTSKSEEDFVQYHVLSSIVHMDDTLDDSFNLLFSSKTTDSITIKMIILSFSKNKESSFLLSPGTFNNWEKDFDIKADSFSSNGNTFSMAGKSCEAVGKKYIICSKNEVSFSAKIKNNGNSSASIRVGFDTYDKKKKGIRGSFYPINNKNEILNVISTAENGKILVVDTEFQWIKGTPLVFDPKDDFSDLPNSSVIGYIDHVEKRDDSHIAITLDLQKKYLVDPVKKNSIIPGTKLRAHSTVGPTLYVVNKTIKPGEEIVVNSIIKQDNDFVLYGRDVFPKGIYSVKPSIRFSSEKENGSIIINDLSISY